MSTAKVAKFQPQAETLPLLQGWQPPAEPDWLAASRRRAEAWLGERGLPHKKLEAWKYTDLGKLSDFVPVPRAPHGLRAADLPEPIIEGAARLVVVDGLFDAGLSDLADLGDGVRLSGLREAIAAEEEAMRTRLESRLDGADLAPAEGMRVLNAARFEDGAALHIGKGKAAARPLEILVITTGGVAAHPVLLLWLESQAEATVVERHMAIGDTAPALNNPVAHVRLEAAARLRHYRLQDDGLEAFHTATNDISVGRDAEYEGFTLSTGAGLSRNQIRAELTAEGGTCRLNGAYVMAGEQHCDTASVIEHSAPHCTSDQTYIGVLDDAAHGVFQGLIYVHPEAQKTDGYQLNRALLLSKKAEIDSKPQLEIYADDVQCSHGATCGQLDETALFYLRSRGISRAAAERLLIRSFIAEAFDTIRDEAVRNAFAEIADARLAKGHP